MPGSDPGDNSSNLFSTSNVVFSLFGKALHCECKEQGSPDSYRDGDNQYGLVYGNTVFPLSFWKVSSERKFQVQFLKPYNNGS